MYVCMYVWMYVCMYVGYVCVYVCTYVCVCMCVCMYVYVCMHMYVCLCRYVYVCFSVCVHMYMYILYISNARSVNNIPWNTVSAVQSRSQFTHKTCRHLPRLGNGELYRYWSLFVSHWVSINVTYIKAITSGFLFVKSWKRICSYLAPCTMHNCWYRRFCKIHQPCEPGLGQRYDTCWS
jgi:nuclear pore complex protein Nup62